MTNVLTGQVPLKDALQPWGDGRLWVLASGPLPLPSELLGSQGMADLLRNLQEIATTIIIDAPPLLPVTDAAVLSHRSSGALLIVRSGQTTRDQLARAAQTLTGVGGPLLLVWS